MGEGITVTAEWITGPEWAYEFLRGKNKLGRYLEGEQTLEGMAAILNRVKRQEASPNVLPAIVDVLQA